MRTAILRWMAAICAASLCVGAGLPATAEEPPVWLYEQESGENVDALLSAADAEQWIQTGNVPVDASSLAVGGKGAVLLEMDGGTVLYEHDCHERLPIASVTKIMTLLLIAEALDEGRIAKEEYAVCSAEAASYGGSQIWLEEGESMTVHELMKAIAVVSANDACAMMAEHLSGSTTAFVAEMNRRAAELGMVDTQFADCCGLDDTAYSSAYDVALMSRELMRHEGITEYTTIWMDTLRGGESQLVNTNKLIRFYKGATGLKTGTTQTAGHCLSATAERDGLRLCAVILGCESTDERFGGARAMLDFGFSNYAVCLPTVDEGAFTPIPVLHGEESSVQPTVPSMERVLLQKGTEARMTSEVTLFADVEAPVYVGETLGEVRVKLDGEVLAVYPVVSTMEIPRLRLRTALRRLWEALAWG